LGGFWASHVSALSDASTRKNAEEEVLWRAFDKAVRRKPLAVAADAGYPMGFESIFAWKALPEADFSKNVVIDFLSIFP
jgi:hypothetical protein